jgi:hypothetical protein
MGGGEGEDLGGRMSLVSFGTRGGDFGDDSASRIFRARTCRHEQATDLATGSDVKLQWCMFCGSIRKAPNEWFMPKVIQWPESK